MHRYSVSAGTPQRRPCRKATAPGRISGAMPIGSSAKVTTLRNANSRMPSIAASHSAWRNKGAISPRRPAPSSCDTAGGKAISVPIGTIIGSQNNAVPTATAASVRVPWWPAITLSTKPIRPVDRWPSTSGAASVALVRSSRAKRGGVGGEAMRKSLIRKGQARSRWRRVAVRRYLNGQQGDPMSDTTITDTPDEGMRPAPPQSVCQNCGTPLLGEHCYACGQPVKGLVRHFSSILGDFLDSVLNIDARVFRTLWPLFSRPGFLSHEYFEGRRVRFVSPVRLFVFLSIVTFFVTQFTLDFSGVKVGNDGNDDAIASAKTVQEVVRNRDATLAELQKAHRDTGDVPGVSVGLDAAATAIRAKADRRIAELKAAKPGTAEAS